MRTKGRGRVAHDTQFTAYKVILQDCQLLKAIASPLCHWYLVWVQDRRCTCAEVTRSEWGRGDGWPAAGLGADSRAGPAFQDPLWPRAGTSWHPGAARVRMVTSSQVVKVVAVCERDVPPPGKKPGKRQLSAGLRAPSPDGDGSCPQPGQRWLLPPAPAPAPTKRLQRRHHGTGP